MEESKRERTVAITSVTPAVLRRRKTCRTRSGRSKAFPSKDLPPRLIVARSVPLLIKDAALFTNTPSGRQEGGGTSSTTTS